MERSPVVFALVLLVTSSTGACRAERPRPNAAPSASASAVVVKEPGWTSSGPFPVDERAYRAVLAWNEALERHDLVKLEKVYANEVLFYGYKRSKADVLAAQRAHFQKHPKFHQEIIGKIELQRVFDDLVQARFTKKSGTPEDFEVVSSKLDLRGVEFLVDEESDEKNSSEQEVMPEGCQAKIRHALDATPGIARVGAQITRDAEKSKGRAQVGGFGPQPDGEGGFDFVEGLSTGDRLESRITYHVDRGGKLTVRALSAEVKIPQAALEAVEQACRH